MQKISKINFKLLVVFTVSILFSSCFQIREIVHFNKDGSGTFELHTDLSELMSMMDMMKGMEGLEEEEGVEDTEDGIDDTEEEYTDGVDEEEDPYEDLVEEEENPLAAYSSTYKDQIDQIRQIAGITDAEVIEDEITNKVGIYFKFKNAKALNDAMNQLYADENKSANRQFFAISKKKVQRFDVVNMKEEVMKSMGEDGEEADASTLEMMKSMFSNVTYTTEYSFDKKIKKSSNSEALVEGNTVILVQKLFDDESKTKLDATIKLK